jgi:folylpolyglutamate synthase/dihydropteroate synthase
LLSKILDEYPKHKIRAVIGFAKDKDHSGVLREVVGKVNWIHLVQAKHVRAMNISRLEKSFKEVEPNSQYQTKCRSILI